MAVDGYLNFDTKINTKGFSSGVRQLGSGLGELTSKLRGVAAAAAAAFSIKRIADFAAESMAAWQVQLEAETKLAQVLRNTTGATQNQIDAVKTLASELQTVGVIGDEITLAGLQELGTYIENADSLKTMSVVLDDMLAQQYGFNATAESAVTISTMLGKVLEGQTSALSRYGYSFTEAQEQLLKYGTEEQRVATLAEVVEASVGGMNAALAQTPVGRMKQLSNTLGDVKEQFGQAFTNLKFLLLPAMERMTALLSAAASQAVALSEHLAAVFGVELNNTAAVTGSISDSIAEQETLTEAVGETAKAQKDLTNLDELHRLSAQDSTAAAAEPGTAAAAVVPVLDTDAADRAADALTERLERILEPVRIAWETNSPALIAETERTAGKLRALFSGIGQSLETVWTNGSGERLVGNLITGFTDLVGIVGDLSGALAEAWEDGGAGTAFVQSVFDRWNSLLELIHAVTDAARTAWNGGAGAAILGDILGILTDINNTWTNLREQFTAAWQENSIGVSIFEHLFGIIRRITGTFRRMSSATAKWAKQLDFSPLLTAFDGLLDAIEPLVDTIGGALADAYEDVLLPLGKWAIEKAAPAAIDLLSGAVSALTAVIDAVKPAAKWLWDEFLQPIAKWTGGAIVFVLGVLGEALRNIADWISRHQALVTGFFKLVGAAFLDAVAPIMTAGAVLMKHWNEIKQFAIDMWAEIERVLRGFFDKVVSIFDSLVNFLKGCWLAIKAVFAGVGKWFSARFREAWEAITGIFSAIGKWFSDRWNDIKRAFSAVGQWFRDLFQKAWDAITGIFSAIGAWFGERWEDIKRVFAAVGKWYGDRFREAWDAVTGIFSAVGSWFGARWQEIKNVFAAVGSFFSGVFTGGWEAVKSAFSGVKRWFSDRWEDIKGVFSGVGTWFSEKFRSAYEGITGIFSKLSGFFSGIWGGVKKVLNTMLSGIESMLNGIVNAANKVISFLNGFSVDIPDWVQGIGGNSIGFHFDELKDVKLPRLASGTVIPANFGEFAAVLGDNRREPEIVSPVSAMKQAFLEALAEQTAGGDQTIVVQLMCDGRKLAEIVRKYNLSGARATNGGVR